METPRLKAVEIVGGALRVGGGAEDGALVLLQDGQPMPDVGGVLVAGLGAQREIGAEKSRA